MPEKTLSLAVEYDAQKLEAHNHSSLSGFGNNVGWYFVMDGHSSEEDFALSYLAPQLIESGLPVSYNINVILVQKKIYLSAGV